MSWPDTEGPRRFVAQPPSASNAVWRTEVAWLGGAPAPPAPGAAAPPPVPAAGALSDAALAARLAAAAAPPPPAPRGVAAFAGFSAGAAAGGGDALVRPQPSGPVSTLGLAIIPGLVTAQLFGAGTEAAILSAFGNATLPARQAVVAEVRPAYYAQTDALAYDQARDADVRWRCPRAPN